MFKTVKGIQFCVLLYSIFWDPEHSITLYYQFIKLCKLHIYEVSNQLLLYAFP